MGQFSENLNGEEEMEPLEMTKAPTFENFRPIQWLVSTPGKDTTEHIVQSSGKARRTFGEILMGMKESGEGGVVGGRILPLAPWH